MTHPACNGGVSLSLGDEVAQQGAGAEETQTDVSGLSEISQHRRVGEVFRARSTVDQRDHNLDQIVFMSHGFLFNKITQTSFGSYKTECVNLHLSVFQRQDPGVVCGADLVIVI